VIRLTQTPKLPEHVVGLAQPNTLFDFAMRLEMNVCDSLRSTSR